MLLELHIENLAILESATVLFEEGLVAVTGESGAGKSVFVGALALVLGGRTDPSMVRSGADVARIDARFIVPGPDGPCERVLTREIPSQGRSRAYLDGRPTTASSISTLFSGLIEIHGQHEFHRLGERVVRCAHLDRFGSIDSGTLREVQGTIAGLEAELAALGGDQVQREREIDLLAYQLHEIDSAHLDPEEPARLATEEARLADADRIVSGAANAAAALDEEEPLTTALRALEASPVLDSLRQRLESVVADLRDLRLELRSMADGLEADPRRLSEIGERRATIADLLRRYGRDVDEVLLFREAIAVDLERLRSHDEVALKLTQRLQLARERAGALSKELALLRSAAAPKLADAVTKCLENLEMASVAFSVSTNGDDGGEVDFGLRLSDGRVLPLSRAASGGELARCMLALDMVLEPFGGRDTVILDEIDAGLGGATGGAMAASLSDLSLRRQVIVVTHLPTVAAVADQQITIAREHESGGSPRSNVAVVTGTSRRDEVARMLAGSTDSDSLQLATRLLSR